MLFSLFINSIKAQDCKSPHGYIIENQQYLVKPNSISKFDIVFYTGFSYRIELCSQFKSIKLNLTLIDEKGNIQYNTIITQGFMHDFRFETVFHGQIIVKPITVDNQNAELLVGYKKI